MSEITANLQNSNKTIDAELKTTQSGGGTTDHAQLINRDAADQHPMSAITGLTEFVNRNKSIPIINNGDDITNLNGVYYFNNVEILCDNGYAYEINGLVTCEPGSIWYGYGNMGYSYNSENQTWAASEVYLLADSEIDYNKLINTPCGHADTEVLISNFKCSGTSPSQSTPLGVDLGIVDGDTCHICGVVWNNVKSIEFDDVYIAKNGYIPIIPYENTGEPVLMIDTSNNSVKVFAANSSIETTVVFDSIAKTNVSKLNEIYIPDTIARTDDIPTWAKQPDKPTYTASEVGALPADTVIPDAYTLPVATSDVLGGVKPAAKTAAMTQEVGIDENGMLYTAPGVGTYTLPTATATTLGGVKIGSGVTVAEDGTISVESGGGSGNSDELKTIRNITINEDTASIEISTDENGAAFALKEMYIWAICFGGTANTAKSNIMCYLNGRNTAAGRFNLGGSEQTLYAPGASCKSGGHVVACGSNRFITDTGKESGTKIARFITVLPAANGIVFDAITQINLYSDTTGFTFGTGTEILIAGR